MKILRKKGSLTERNRREYRLRTEMGERPERAAEILRVRAHRRPVEAVHELGQEIAHEQARDALLRRMVSR